MIFSVIPTHLFGDILDFEIIYIIAYYVNNIFTTVKISNDDMFRVIYIYIN